MPLTEAKRASNRKSDMKYQQILLKPYKEDGQLIREFASAAGQSVQGYILQAVRERMDREKNQLKTAENP